MSHWSYSPNGKFAIRPEPIDWLRKSDGTREWSKKYRNCFEFVDFEQNVVITFAIKKSMVLDPVVLYWLSDFEFVYLHYSVKKPLATQILYKLCKRGKKWKTKVILKKEFMFGNKCEPFVVIPQCPLKIHQKEFMVISVRGWNEEDIAINLVPKDPRSLDNILELKLKLEETLESLKQNFSIIHRFDFDPKPLVFVSRLIFPMFGITKCLRFLSLDLAKWKMEEKTINKDYVENNSTVLDFGSAPISMFEYTIWQDEHRAIVRLNPPGTYYAIFYFDDVIPIRNSNSSFCILPQHGRAILSIHPSGIMLSSYSEDQSIIFSKDNFVVRTENNTTIKRLSQLAADAILFTNISRNNTYIPKFIPQEDDKITLRKVSPDGNWFKRNFTSIFFS